MLHRQGGQDAATEGRRPHSWEVWQVKLTERGLASLDEFPDMDLLDPLGDSNSVVLEENPGICLHTTRKFLGTSRYRKDCARNGEREGFKQRLARVPLSTSDGTVEMGHLTQFWHQVSHLVLSDITCHYLLFYNILYKSLYKSFFSQKTVSHMKGETNTQLFIYSLEHTFC